MKLRRRGLKIYEGKNAIADVWKFNIGAKKARGMAQLFITAPDLLEACVEFVRKCDNGEARSTKSYAQMKSAIEKAQRFR